MRGVNDVVFNYYVLVDEIRRIGVVGNNVVYFRRR